MDDVRQMQEKFRLYIISLYQDMPQEVYEGLLSVFCLGVVLFVAFKGIRTGFRWSSVLLLIEYIFLLFCSTVIFRTAGATRRYDFHPFWSYDRPELLVENIMNVIVFIPVGMILGSLLRVKGNTGSRFFDERSDIVDDKVNGSWTSQATKSITWLVALLIGCSISVTIESLQFFFLRGFSEVDDVMHNTLGCVMGWLMVKGSLTKVRATQGR